MTEDELERAKDYAYEKGTFDELYDEGGTYYEYEDGVSFKAWVFVPKEAYREEVVRSEGSVVPHA